MSGTACSGLKTDLSALIDQSSVALAYFDSCGGLEYFNDCFREMFAGPETGVALGARFDALIPMARGQSRKRGACGKFLQRARDGRWLLGEARHTPDGGMLCSFSNVSALKAVEAGLRRRLEVQRLARVAAEEACEDAEEAANIRTDSIAKISHELRTPLNAILGFAEVMKSDLLGAPDMKRYREYCEIIHQSGTHLLELVNDVLDMSKLDAGKLEINFAPVDMCRLVIDAVRNIEPQAKRAGICIGVVFHDGVGLLEGDGRRLRQMLLNLLSNAIKFTPRGGEVRITVFRQGEHLAVAVSDTGIGIGPEDIGMLMQPFAQVQNNLTRKIEGTGLGLSLTRELAELHGGTLTLESTVDVGTTATILLPCAATSVAGRQVAA